jgi:hypothetical protein
MAKKIQLLQTMGVTATLPRKTTEMKNPALKNPPSQRRKLATLLWIHQVKVLKVV